MSAANNHFDVIVLGVGSMGSAACYHLAKRGIKVLGLEQFDIPHNQGSHHGKSRMIRKAYYEHPDYVPLLERAYELWDELEADATEKIIYRTGGLYLGSSYGSIITGSLESARKHGLPHRYLNHAEICEQFPSFQVPETFEGYFESEGGFIRPEDAVQEHAHQAEKNGARILASTPVLDWVSSPDGVEVKSSAGNFSAGQLIICAGAWTGPILRDLGIELTVTRQVQAWFEPKDDPKKFTHENFPCWFIETDPPHGHYGFPTLPSQKGLKIAEHKPGEPILADQVGQAVDPPNQSELDDLQRVLNTFIPGAAGQLLKSCTCLYTNSPDQHFIVGKHPELDPVSLAAGFSGHGYKFASVMGEILADLATNGATRHSIEFLSPKRFG
ncbi:MAG: N-methyl-L-tryptophan oxidase [Verrucomicrobia bacterium]|nr:N-methyl-L-tryptophan oxidase [Verrucomicrobiota bacterium]